MCGGGSSQPPLAMFFFNALKLKNGKFRKSVKPLKADPQLSLSLSRSPFVISLRQTLSRHRLEEMCFSDVHVGQRCH